MWKKFKPPNRLLRGIKRWWEERHWLKHRQFFVARYYWQFKQLAELLTIACAEPVYFALEPEQIRVRIYTGNATLAHVSIRKSQADGSMSVLVRTDLTDWYLIWFKVAFLSITSYVFEPSELVLGKEVKI